MPSITPLRWSSASRSLNRKPRSEPVISDSVEPFLDGPVDKRNRIAIAAWPVVVADVDGPRLLVWLIHNVRLGESIGDRKGHYVGIAFAAGPRDFITALHVLLGHLSTSMPISGPQNELCFLSSFSTPH